MHILRVVNEFSRIFPAHLENHLACLKAYLVSEAGSNEVDQKITQVAAMILRQVVAFVPHPDVSVLEAIENDSIQIMNKSPQMVFWRM